MWTNWSWSSCRILSPEAGEVRIRVEASGLNYADIMQREALSRWTKAAVYFRSRSGGRGRSWRRVAGGAGDGRVRRWLSCGALVCQRGHVHAHSGFDVFRRSCCFSGPISDRVSRAHDSWQSCSRRNRFDSCSGGGVGTAAVQIAKLLGLRVVGTASSEEKRACARARADEALSYEEFDQSCWVVKTRRR